MIVVIAYLLIGAVCAALMPRLDRRSAGREFPSQPYQLWPMTMGVLMLITFLAWPLVMPLNLCIAFFPPPYFRGPRR